MQLLDGSERHEPPRHPRKLRNSGSKTAKSPHFSVRFFDAQGELIDSLPDSSYNLLIPPGREVSFRIRGPAHRSEREYASYELELTGASVAR